MRAFHSDPKIKSKYVKRVVAHRLADNLIRGAGWSEGKGCAVGCTLEKYDHKSYETELGIPEWLAWVEDTLYEGMSLQKSKTWPEKFLKAISVGDDLEKVKGKFLIPVLKSALKNFDNKKFPQVTESIREVIKLYQKKSTFAEFNQAGRKAASTAASIATESAVWSAAYAAVYAATAYAAATGYTADRTKIYDRLADDLLKILISVRRSK